MFRAPARRPPTPCAAGNPCSPCAAVRAPSSRSSSREAFAPPAFPVRPLGYDRAHVDDVIRRGRDMLTSTAWYARRDMAAELLPPHPIAAGGYDRVQVDRFTRRLSASKASRSR